MRKPLIRLSRDEIRRIIFLKKEYKNIILKSILRNRQTNNNVRMFTLYKIQKNTTFLSRQKNFCILTGRAGGVWKISNTSRHCLNKFLQEGMLTNIKVNNIK